MRPAAQWRRPAIPARRAVSAPHIMRSVGAPSPEALMEESPFAYSLCQADDGWTWRLWDETGDVIAAGDAPDQLSAQSRLLEAFERARTGGAASPA
jgi:hypothetical protein